MRALHKSAGLFLLQNGCAAARDTHIRQRDGIGVEERRVVRGKTGQIGLEP